MRRVRRTVTAVAAAAVTGLALLAAATADGTTPKRDAALARDLQQLDRTAVWQEVSKLDLKFPTFHPEGLVVTADRIYLSSTEIIEPTVTYPKPIGGYDRSPGKGVGHLFVMNRAGTLLKDIRLGHGIVYHPGGIDLAGKDILVPVAQYRPFSSAEILRVDTRTLRVRKAFAVHDHIGGIVYDKDRNRLVGNNWGSRTFYEWTPKGRTVATWANPQNTLDFQDCQYVATSKMACGGITNLKQTPAASATGYYELGGVALLDLREHRLLNMVPFQYFSSASHVLTRNPVKLVADGATMTLWAAPDNGEDVAGTQLFEYRTTLKTLKTLKTRQAPPHR